MIKSFALLPRRPDISEEQFHRHWSTIHRDHALRITTLRRYVQLHRTQEALPGFAPSIYDGVPEAWLDSLEDALALGTDPNYLQHAAKDEPNFIDMERMGGLVATEEVRIEGPLVRRDTSLVKGMLLVKAKLGVAQTSFLAWWREEFGELVQQQVPNLTRFVQCTPVAQEREEEAPPFDGVAELWWSDLEQLEQAHGGLERLGRTLRDGPVETERTVSLVGEELRVIWPDA